MDEEFGWYIRRGWYNVLEVERQGSDFPHLLGTE